VFQTKAVEKIKTHKSTFIDFSFSKITLLMR